MSALPLQADSTTTGCAGLFVARKRCYPLSVKGSIVPVRTPQCHHCVTLDTLNLQTQRRHDMPIDPFNGRKAGKEPEHTKPIKSNGAKRTYYEPRPGRRIVVFLDGTSNTPEELRHTARHDLMRPPPITNVVRLLRGVVTDDEESDLAQVIGYFRGVATEGSVLTRLTDTISGRGLSRIVLDAYRFISHNLEWTDVDYAKVNNSEVFIFGFSRGAYAARALSGFLHRLGLIKKEGLWLLPFFFKEYQKLLSTGQNFDSRTEKIWNKHVQKEFPSIPVRVSRSVGHRRRARYSGQRLVMDDGGL